MTLKIKLMDLLKNKLSHLYSFNYPIELIKLASETQTKSAIANFGAVLIFIFALKEYIPQPILFTWFFIHLSIILIRSYFFYQLKIDIEASNDTISKNHSNFNSNFNNKLKFIISLFFISGCLWGIAVWMSIIYAPIDVIFLCLLIILGLAGGAIATLSPVQHIYTAFVMPMMAVQFFALLYKGETIYYFVAVLTILYVPTVYKASYSLYSHMLQGIHQRYFR